jgi:hypothetical protein
VRAGVLFFTSIGVVVVAIGHSFPDLDSSKSENLGCLAF